MITRMKSDVEIQRDVQDEIAWDPEIEVTDVGVELDDGIVTLTGTVDTFARKWAAERAAFRVAGVRAVANDIVVRTDSLGYRTDTDLARAVADAFETNLLVPAGRIEIRVGDGVVTLDGVVDWYYQRAAAERAVRDLAGVTLVNNLITVQQPPVSRDEIQEGIEKALVRSAEVDADRITVEVDDGHVTLTGVVRSWSERKEAEEAAWKARGVTRVDNEIRIVVD